MSSHLTKADKLKAETDLLRTIQGHVRELKGYKDNEARLLDKIEQQGEELTDLKQDYIKLVNLDCRQCLKQEQLIKKLDSEKKWQPIALAGWALILIIIIGWWLR